MIIKILLISGVIGAVVYALRGSQSSTNLAIRRLGGILFALVAAISIIFPDSVTWIAQAVNVGRGTDLVLYGVVVWLLIFMATTYQRFRHTEISLTKLSRRIAIDETPRVWETDGK